MGSSVDGRLPNEPAAARFERDRGNPSKTRVALPRPAAGTASATTGFRAGGVAMKIEDFADRRPAFRPETFFSSRLEGWGVLEGATGAIHKRFTVQAEG